MTRYERLARIAKWFRDYLNPRDVDGGCYCEDLDLDVTSPCASCVSKEIDTVLNGVDDTHEVIADIIKGSNEIHEELRKALLSRIQQCKAMWPVVRAAEEVVNNDDLLYNQSRNKLIIALENVHAWMDANVYDNEEEGGPFEEKTATQY